MTPLSKDTYRFLRYLSFKMDCLREQEANPLTIDVAKAQKHFDELETIINEKTEALAKVMPKRPIEKYRNKPKLMHTKDGNLSKLGESWYELLKEQHLPSTTEGVVTIVEGWEDGNPGSPSQVKEWLYSLGWKPCTYKFDRNKATGEEKKIEQVRYFSPSDPRKGELTDSVLKLKAVEQGVEILEGLTVAGHRKGIFKALLDNADLETCGSCGGTGDWHTDRGQTWEPCPRCKGKGHEGYGRVVARAGGFTNTLRLKHRSPIVNLPKVGSPWGEEIRGCIIAPPPKVRQGECKRKCSGVNVPCTKECAIVDTYTVCGADVSSLESCTKRHYMWDYDPEYVTEMSKEGFDEHLDLAKHAGEVTQEQIDLYNQGKAPELKVVRNVFKPANYAGVYGVRELTLSRQTGMGVQRCKELLDAYWERNWAVQKIAQSQYIKELPDGSKWLKNPVSGFYYSLRYEKDAFSTLNQGTGVFVFDSWVMHMRNNTYPPVVVSLQMHDEILSYTKIGNEDRQTEALEKAMEKVNETLKLNVEITSDIQYGESYAAVH